MLKPNMLALIDIETHRRLGNNQKELTISKARVQYV